MSEMVGKRAAGYLERIARMAPLIREHAERSEREARLASEVVESFHDAGLFRIFLPARMGGGELTLPESLRLFEAMARIDGSAGWNLAICGGGPLIAHFLTRAAFEEVFSDPRAVLAGSLNPVTTRVVPCDGGYRLSGRATFASGSAHANWLMAAGFIVRDGAPQVVDGIPEMRAGLIPIARCRILDTWSVCGMRATGSNDCAFEDVFVPEGFTFGWPDATSAWQHGAFATVPLTTQLGVALSAVALGVARHAIDALMEIALTKVPAGTRATLRERPLAQLQIGQAEGLLRAARAYLHQAYDDVWRRGEGGEPFDATARAEARLASVTATKLAAEAVDLIHDAAGMSAVQIGGDLQRCWRDIHTITQHVVLGTGRYEVVGRVLLGLDPGSPII